MKEVRINRAASRELLMRVIFAGGDLNSGNFPDFDAADPKHRLFPKNGKTSPDMDYIEEVLRILKEHGEKIDAVIDGASDKWSISRMGKPDLSVLRLAAAEILYIDGISDAVAISEAVYLAEKYGTGNSKSFVNGVLGKISRDNKAVK
ncbi:MAG: transcription antitermination factor NusB [Clostridiales Family XIII bacterium]|jgi:N utilization substance protein B|nr:transcription antitermination factor NusB [Clostridiales Family XIII bacterium]